MSQINLRVRPAFEKALARFMKVRGFSTKSEAIRVAVAEGLERALGDRSQVADFHSWRGAALRVPPNPNPRFASDDDLWKKNGG